MHVIHPLDAIGRGMGTKFQAASKTILHTIIITSLPTPKKEIKKNKLFLPCTINPRKNFECLAARICCWGSKLAWKLLPSIFLIPDTPPPPSFPTPLLKFPQQPSLDQFLSLPHAINNNHRIHFVVLNFKDWCISFCNRLELVYYFYKKKNLA